jgi:predicted lactoylglutathione lyase
VSARGCGFNLPSMDDATINAAVSRFLKSVSVSAHREIEKVVRKAIASGAAREGEVLTVGVTLASEKLDLDITIFNKIDL